MLKYYILENKIDDLHNTLDKCIKRRDNFILILDSQREIYNIVSIGYEPKNNTKKYSNIFHLALVIYVMLIEPQNLLRLNVIVVLKW